MSQNKRCVTDPAKISFWGAGDYSEMVAGARLRLHTALVDIDVVENPEDELPTRKSLREQSLGVHCPGTVQNEALDPMHSSISLL